MNNKSKSNSTAAVEQKKSGFFSRFSKGLFDRLGPLWDKLSQKFVSFSKDKYYYYLAFGLPILILIITYIAVSISPFGAKSVLTVDMDGQYVYFFEQLRDVYTGNASLFYTFERALGGEFLGCFTYYLASPLSFLVVLFPATAITEAIAMIFLLKSGFAGLTFAIYLSHTRKKNPAGFTMFSVMYALCAYAVMFQFNTMWMDALIWLPLIVLGLECLVKEGKYRLFIISLALAVCSNYYVGYMLCIFVAIYFFAFVLSKSSEETNLINEENHFIKSLFRVGVSSVIALMLAAGIIFSAYYALSFGKSSFQDNSFNVDLRFDFLQLIAKSFLGSFDTIRDQGTPNIYSGLFPLLLLPLFYFSKKVSSREKVVFTTLALIFVASFSINTFDLMWHGFQAPIWFNYRYSFLLSFVILLMAYRGYESIDEHKMPILGKSAIGISLLLILVQRLVVLTRYEHNGSTWVPFDFKPDLTVIWLSLLFVLLYVLVIFVRKRTLLLKATTILLVVIVCAEALVNSIITWDGIFAEGGVASRNNYRTYVDNLGAVTDELNEMDDSLYRTEHLFNRKSNDNLVLDLKGGSEFTSTFNASTLKFLERLGFNTGGQSVLYTASNPITDSLLGFKYIISSDDSEKDAVTKANDLYHRIIAKNGYYVYQNPYVLPFAYRVDKDFELALEKTEFFNGNEFLSSYNTNLLDCMLGKDSNVLTICDYTFNKGELEKTRVDADGGKSFYSPDDSKPCSFSYTVTPSTDGNIYIRLPSPYTTATKIYVNDSTTPLTNNYFQDKNKSLVNLGSFKAGEEVIVKLEFTWYRLYLWNTEDYFVQIDKDALNDAMDTLRSSGMRVSEHSDTSIVGTISSDDNGPVFTTIPYDSNWRVYVDGERVETYKMIDTMLGFDITEGKHTVELEYVHTPFLIGSIISIIGIDLLILLWILEKKFGFRIIPIKTIEYVDDDEGDVTQNTNQADLQENSESTINQTTNKTSEENNDLSS